ncbi:ROK family protein [Thermomonospora umbrina]|uniref:Putative NBD/HSP70 family sugar kinase n=1 Tax=Thermomonospora umbrina TaxID=111806 RepID=A0A3D9SV20_9ACTN|nr:ROK family protein [Thermomonospora umbrina]REE99809.1 putative NBD/HSP70 family sugar kinase [Thermomonospora umbrina]
MSEVPLHGGDPSVLRRLNAANTLRALRDGGGAPTVTELAAEVGVSRPTAESALAELAARGLVEEVAPDTGRRLGRPARRYRFRAEAGHALGMEIDAHRVLLYVADLDGRVLGDHRADLEVDAGPRERLAAVRAAVKDLLAGLQLERSALWAVGAGTPGVIDSSGRVIRCTVVPGWEGVDLARELGRSFPCPVLVENDANLAAVAERWRGVARDTDDVVYFLAGMHTGVGAVIGGRLHRGRWGAAGEVGMLPELGLTHTSATLAGDTDPAEGGGRPDVVTERTARRVLEAARGGDAEARRLLEGLAARMARGIAAMVLALDPEMVVIGGTLTEAGDLLVTRLREHVRPLCLSPTRIETSALGDESVGLGALRAALDRIEADMFRLDAVTVG